MVGQRGRWAGDRREHYFGDVPTGSRKVRGATEADAEACAAIYAPYVTDTAVTFETVAPRPPEMAERIETAAGTHAWVVLEDGDHIVGYAYGAPFRSRAAYRWSCEVSVYLAHEHRGSGGGRALYSDLFTRLTARGFRTAVAGMTLPNDASVALHRAMAFEPVGTFRRAGWKNGRWHDVCWVQRALSAGQDPPVDPW